MSTATKPWHKLTNILLFDKHDLGHARGTHVVGTGNKGTEALILSTFGYNCHFVHISFSVEIVATSCKYQ
jgi:hypothetical protein